MPDSQFGLATQALDTSADLRSVMTAIRAHTRPLLGADGVTFVMRDHDLCFYADEDAIGPLWKGRRFPMNTCISGWAMTHGTTVVVPDVYADPRIPADAYRPTFVKSLAMAPVGRHGGRMVAAIGAYWAEPRTASVLEVDILNRLAERAAEVLEQICPRCHLRGVVHDERTITAEAVTRVSICSNCDHAWTSPAFAERL